LGSLLLAKKIKTSLTAWHLILPIFYLFALIFACLAKIALKNSGVIPNLGPALAWALLAIGPVGLGLGVLFVLLTQNIKKTSWYSASLAFSLESIGFLVGALIFNFWAYQLADLVVVWALSFFSLLLAISFSNSKNRRLATLAFLCLLFIAPKLPQLNNWLIQKQYSGKILNFANTKLGPVVITQQNEQKNFYHNGHLVFTSQNQQAAELITHLPLLLAKQTNNILVIGNLNPNLIKEINKYQPQNLTLLELDKDYYYLVNQNKKPAYAHLAFADARAWLNDKKNIFDVIIINYSNPNTLADNRYFTRQAFALFKSALRTSGILAFVVNTTPNYTIGGQNKLLAAYYHTLKKEFSQILVLPDNEVIFLAANKPINTNLTAIKTRWEKLKLNNQYVTPQLINWRLTNDRAQWLAGNLKSEAQLINTDQRPLIWWLETKIFLKKVKGQNLISILALFLAAGALALGLIIKQQKKPAWLALSALAEAFLLCFEVILILWFEAKLGWLYTQLSLIIALILVGLSLGSFASLFILRKNIKPRQLLPYSYFLIFTAFLIPWVLTKYFIFTFQFSLTFYFLALFAGFSVGTKFPLINKIYLKNNQNLGAVYGADLLGAGLGALISIIALPLIGITNTLLGLTIGSGLCLLGLVVKRL
jgi:predicted membrane-bound spermidine synthase